MGNTLTAIQLHNSTYNIQGKLKRQSEHNKLTTQNKLATS